MTEDPDMKRWREAGERNGWVLPPKAAWPLRLPVIRYLRCVWLSVKIETHYALWSGGCGSLRSGYDEWVLFAIACGMI